MITSTSNPQVKQLQALIKKTKERSQSDLFVVEGVRMYREAPPERVAQTYVSEQFYHKNRTMIRETAGVTVLADHVFAVVSDTKTPQGILCLVRQYHYGLRDLLGAGTSGAEARGGNRQAGNSGETAGDGNCAAGTARPLLVVLEGLQDPGNLGTILRTAEGAGATGVLMSGDCVDIYNPKVIRSTMGSVYRVPFCYSRDWQADLAWLKRQGVRLFAAHLGGAEFYDRPDYRAPSAFLIGNEGRGLTEETAALADARIRIPMRGQVESLNAAVSASILMYEANRQRRNPV